MKINIDLIPKPAEPYPMERDVFNYTDLTKEPPHRSFVPRGVTIGDVCDAYDVLSDIIDAVDDGVVSQATYGPLADALRPVVLGFRKELEGFDVVDSALKCTKAFSDDERSAREIAMGKRRAEWEEAVAKAKAYNAETEPLRKQWRAYRAQQALLAKLRALSGEG